MAKKIRNTALKLSNETTRPHVTSSTSEGSSFVTQAKAALKRFRNKALPKTIPKESTTYDEHRTILDGQGSTVDSRGVGDEGSLALSDQRNQPISAITGNALVVVHQTSNIGSSSGDVPVQEVESPAIAAATVVPSGDDQLSHIILSDVQGADKKPLTVKSIPTTAETAVNANTAILQLDAINAAYPAGVREYFDPIMSGQHGSSSSALNQDYGLDSLTSNAITDCPAGSTHPALRMDPAKVRQHFDRIGHFRILVIGRSNAGKTTILQRVCNTTELPEITNAKGEKVDPVVVQGTLERGYHNIEDELIFRSNPGFIFHDSRGFEAGSDSELKLMKKFVAERATTMKLDKRIHAIWFCIPMTDYERTIVAAEKKFFNECNTAKVPVIVVLTKADALQFAAIEQLIDQGCTIEEAKEKAGEAAIQMLSKLKMRIETQLDRCKYPPKDCVSLASMNEDHGDCNPLLRCTTNALDEVELQKLVISTQQVNIVLNIEYAVKVILSTCNDPFHKEALEWNILGWMPCAKVWQHQQEWQWWHEQEWEWRLQRQRWERLQQEQWQEWEEELNHQQDHNLIEDCVTDAPLTLPLMFPLSIVTSYAKTITHGVGCILVFEYSYFCLQAQGDIQDIFSHASKEYQDSGTQATVCKALEQAIQQHHQSHDNLQQAIISIILANHMSNKFLPVNK